MHESPIFKKTNPNPITIKQDIIYHKQALYKAGIWRTKTENLPEVKVKEEPPETVSPGQWIEFVMSDVKRKTQDPKGMGS